MSGLVHVFCKADPPPRLKELFDLLSEEGFDVHKDVDDEFDDQLDSDDIGWTEATLVYSDEQEPFRLECWQDEQSDEFADLRDELLADIEDSDGNTDRVIKHLQRSTFVITIDLQSDDEEGLSILNTLIIHLASEFDGLSYVDGEGFYAADELILEVA